MLTRLGYALPLVLLLVVSIPRTAACQGHSLSEAVRKMTLAEGLTATLFAGEPEVRQPIFCKVDDRGRLWTIQYLQYPNPAGLKRVKVDRYSRTVYDRVPKPPPHGPRGADRITILEDTDGDGRADRHRDFVTGLNLCTGVEFGYGGVFVIQAPYLLFYPDRDRDDVPDGDPEVLLEGFGMEDAQSLANHLTWGPDGWLYGLNGSTTTCRIRGIEFQQGVWRYHPVSKRFELFCEGGGNVFGLTFDAQGRLFYSSNGGVFYHGVQGAYYEKNFGKHGPLHNPYAYGYFSHVPTKGTTGRPNTGATMYLARSFPQQFHGALLLGDFLTHTCSWWKVKPRGSTVEAELGGLWLNSNDTWFGATDVCLGPDGEVYVCDFHDQRTAHPDPDAQWDRSNGRIYRIQASQVERSRSGNTEPLDLAKRSTDHLVGLLSHPNAWYRQHARRLLAERRDASAWPELRRLVMQESDHQLALEALWAAHVSDGWNAALSDAALRHPSEHVRAWAVRLLGDAGQVSDSVARRLNEMCEEEPSVVVRAQLAATARRLPGNLALPMIHALLARDLDDQDPYIPWLLWWALESKAVSDRDRVLRLFARPEHWANGSFRGNLRRLARRYAAEGSEAGYTACHAIWQSAPAPQQESVLAAVHEGLAERPRDDSTTGVTEPLLDRIQSAWSERPDDPPRIRLALEAELDAAYRHVLDRLHDELGERTADQLRERLSILVRYGREDCIAVVLPLARGDHPLAVRREALAVLSRFDDEAIIAAVLEDYAEMPEALKPHARRLLLKRTASSLAFLERIDRGEFPAEEVTVEELRPLALFGNSGVDRLVRKHWGNIQPGTPEEKLADVRRFQNDLRAGAGDAAAGRMVFQKHCGTCHTPLHEPPATSPPPLGPDLSGTVRGDRQSLLTNIVDPSAVVRREYLSYVVLDVRGAVHTGLIAEQDEASVTLVDARNERTRIPRDEIDSLRPSPVSLMPERLLEPLSPQQRRDLFAYLQQAPSRETDR